MSTTEPLAPNATARLTMTSGSPCSIAEFAMFLDQYEYIQDPADQHRWLLDDPESRNAAEPCAIVLGDLNAPAEIIDVYGQGNEHYTNLNYLMQRGGWKSCSVVCRNDDISAKMLIRFVSVDVTSDITLPASSLDANEPEKSAAGTPAPVGAVDHAPAPSVGQPMSNAVNDPALSDTGSGDTLAELAAANHRVRELTIKLNASQEMLEASEADNSALKGQIQELQGQVERSAQQLAAQRTAAANGQPALTATAPSGSQLLMKIIDEYLLPTVDISSPASSKLIEDLRAAGYSVQLRLVRAA